MMKQLLSIIGLLFCVLVTGQYTATGVVYDSDGQPLPGVTVLEYQGGEPGPVTNMEGQFSIPCYNERPTLYFMGYRYLLNIVLVDSSYYVSLEMEHSKRLHYKKYEGKRAGKLYSDISGNIMSECYVDELPATLHGIGIKVKLKDKSSLTVYFKGRKDLKQAYKDGLLDWDILRKERIEMINHFH